jgi:hypothetical protein
VNIFILSDNPVDAAIQHNDKHVVKMILESAQLLSTAHRLLDGTERIDKRYVNGSMPARYRNVKVWDLPDNRDGILYQATHRNHPSAIWCRETTGNYKWLWQLLHALTDEYYYRYGQYKGDTGVHHKVRSSGLMDALMRTPDHILRAGRTDFPQCMPDQYKVEGNAVQAYRNYYLGEKRDILKYTNREEPTWI